MATRVAEPAAVTMPLKPLNHNAATDSDIWPGFAHFVDGRGARFLYLLRPHDCIQRNYKNSNPEPPMPDASPARPPVYVRDWDSLDDHKYMADSDICAQLLREATGPRGPLDDQTRAVVRAEAESLV